ncbi:MAG: acyltransferase [Promethearchaeota archaeon]
MKLYQLGNKFSFNMISYEKEGDFREFDILRGFAIIFVVIIHTFGLVYHFNEGLEYLLTYGTLFTIAQSAVPIFLFISGYFLRFKYMNDRSLKSIFRARFIKIIPPYLLFSVIYILFNNWKYQQNISVLEGLYKILSFSAEFHFWFIGLIVFFYLFFPLINICFERSKKRNFLLGSFVLQLTWIVFEIYINNEFLFNPELQVAMFFVKNSIFSYIFYFVLGMYIAENYNEIKNKLIKKKYFFVAITIFLPSVFTVFYFIMNLWYFKLITLPISIPAILIFYVISLKLKKKNFGEIFRFFGRYSYGIYYIHPLITSLLINIFLIGAFFYLTLFCNVLLISSILIYFISQMPYSKFLIGKIRKP